MKYSILIIAGLNTIFGCNPFPNLDTFDSIEHTSSKGEKIYINSFNWGITGNSQLTIISKDKDALKIGVCETNCIKGLEPFIYSFDNDTLTLYFSWDERYKVDKKFISIGFRYVALEPKDYNKLIIKTMDNDDYHSVPHNKVIEYPADFPPPPPNPNKN